MPVWLATTITALVFLGVLTGFGILAWVNIAALGRGLPLYQEELLQLARSLEAWLQATVGAPLEIELDLTALAELGAVSIPSFMLSTARSTVSVLLAFLMVYLFAVLFLAGKHYFPRKLVRAFPRTATGQQSPVLVILKHIDDSLRRFIAMKTLISVAVGGATAIVAGAVRSGLPGGLGLAHLRVELHPVRRLPLRRDCHLRVRAGRNSAPGHRRSACSCAPWRCRRSPGASPNRPCSATG